MTEQQKSSSNKFKNLRNVIFLIIGFGLFYLVFKDKNFDELLGKFKNADYTWIIISLILVIPAHLFRAARWILLIEPLGYKPKITNTFLAIMTGYFANMAIPKFGEVIRCWTLKETDKIPVSSLLGTVIVERTIDLITLLTIITLVVVVKLELFGDFIINNVLGQTVNKFTFIFDHWQIILISGSVLVVLPILLLYWKKDKIKNTKVFNVFYNKISGLIEGIVSIKKLEHRGKFIIYTFLIWICYLISFYLSFYALEATAVLTFLDSIVVFAFSSLAWAVPIQGGIGAYHWITTKGLEFTGVAHVDGLVYSTIKHASVVLFNIVAGGLCLLIVMFKKGDTAETKQRFLNRNITNSLRFLLDNLLPKFIRNNRYMMYPLFYIWYKGKNVKEIMDFKSFYREMSFEEFSTFYQSVESIDKDRKTDLNAESIKDIIDNIEDKNATILDIACGRGGFLEKLYNKGYTNLHGCDLYDEFHIEGSQYTKGNIEQLPFADNQFDYVVSSHTMQHAFNIEQAVAELKRVAKKKLIIVVPKQKYFKYTFDLNLHFFSNKSDLTNLIDIKDHICINKKGDWLYIGNIENGTS
ncbi:MAG: flippase-like domain-containing protein [Bacteroidia bacterium]|nr:flippase-like domain-containing protein [Bacteroidia bacterium]